MSNRADRARYEQIADHLRGLVAEGGPGDRLPSEAELCAEFGVSRMTARQAVQVVANDGLIDRRRGAGTFIRSRTVPRHLGSPLSFTGSMRARGMSTTNQTLGRGETDLSPEEAEALGLQPGARGFMLERLRLADGTPMAIERALMPSDLAAAVDDDFATGSLHDAFRAIGRSPTEAYAEVSARRATRRERDLLGLPASGIIVSERRTIFDQDGAPLEHTETLYAASRYSFRAILRESEPGS
jgi:GntR family transcriptional regulator